MYAWVTLDHASLRRARLQTGLATAVILTGMIVILWLCARLVLGTDAVLAVSAAILVLLLASTTPPASLFLRLLRAEPVPPAAAADLYADLAELARRAGLRACPTLWWLGSPGLNAFAVVGGGEAGIAVSDGALRHLSRQELTAVLAHEVAHLAAGDTRLMTVGIVLLRVTQFCALLGLLAAFVLLLLTGDPEVAPLWLLFLLGAATPAAAMLHLALSRNREFAADLHAAQLTGDAVGLARALERIERCQRGAGHGHRWLRTHPPTAERVDRLLGNARLVPGRSGLLFG